MEKGSGEDTYLVMPKQTNNTNLNDEHDIQFFGRKKNCFNFKG